MQRFRPLDRFVNCRALDCEHETQITQPGVAAQPRIEFSRPFGQRRNRGELIVPQSITAGDQQQRRRDSNDRYRNAPTCCRV